MKKSIFGLFPNVALFLKRVNPKREKISSYSNSQNIVLCNSIEKIKLKNPGWKIRDLIDLKQIITLQRFK